MKHIKKFNEGVADEYAEKRFYFPNPNKDFEYKYQNYIAKIPPVGYVADDYNKDKLTAIFKNPKNLRNFEPNVRAIGTLDGDLYVAQRDSSFYHRSMGEQLKLVEDGEKIYDLNDKFVFCYRLRDKPAFAIGVSTEFFNDDSEENVKITENILKNIKRKNPQFSFYNFTKSQIYSLGEKARPVVLDITEPKPDQPKTPFSFGADTKKQGMFTKFKKFIKNESLENNPIDNLKEKIETEFSKYLKETPSEAFKTNVWPHLNSDTIFLLNDDYGCRISSIIPINRGIYRDDPRYIVQVCSIKNNPTTNNFRNGNLVDNYDSRQNISVEDFVKKFIEKLKKTNEQRLKNRETTRIKRASKKFNI